MKIIKKNNYFNTLNVLNNDVIEISIGKFNNDLQLKQTVNMIYNKKEQTFTFLFNDIEDLKKRNNGEFIILENNPLYEPLNDFINGKCIRLGDKENIWTFIYNKKNSIYLSFYNIDNNIDDYHSLTIMVKHKIKDRYEEVESLINKLTSIFYEKPKKRTKVL